MAAKTMLRKQAALTAAINKGLISEIRPLALFIDQDDVRKDQLARTNTHTFK